VTEDPDVPLYTVVRSLVITVTKENLGRQTMDKRHGLLYVKDGELRYDAAFGTRLMPKSDTKYWKLQEIQHVTAITCETLTVEQFRQPPVVVCLNPGLDIHLVDATGTETRLQMAMPYVQVSSAETFKSHLDQIVLTAKQRE
jgi:hypothetical protein